MALPPDIDWIQAACLLKFPLSGTSLLARFLSNIDREVESGSSKENSVGMNSVPIDAPRGGSTIPIEAESEFHGNGVPVRRAFSLARPDCAMSFMLNIDLPKLFNEIGACSW